MAVNSADFRCELGQQKILSCARMGTMLIDPARFVEVPHGMFG